MVPNYGTAACGTQGGRTPSAWWAESVRQLSRSLSRSAARSAFWRLYRFTTAPWLYVSIKICWEMRPLLLLVPTEEVSCAPRYPGGAVSISPPASFSGRAFSRACPGASVRRLSGGWAPWASGACKRQAKLCRSCRSQRLRTPPGQKRSPRLCNSFETRPGPACSPSGSARFFRHG